jgi:hypothetical protein
VTLLILFVSILRYFVFKLNKQHVIFVKSVLLLVVAGPFMSESNVTFFDASIRF